MKNFEVGEHVHFIYAGKLRTGNIKKFTQGQGEIYAHIKVDDTQVCVRVTTDNIAKLDQPEPVVVPEFVAEWYEANKNKLDSALWEVIGSLRFASPSELTPIQNFIYNSGETIETLSAMKNGYVVEEEKKYYVKLIPMEEGFLNLLTETETYDINSALEGKGFKTKFTEKEIKAIDEKLWAFAVPVEEVEAE
ncbi:DUF1642 domain-containing protein [Listeria monocytogenes]|nr:DUF1642 domain-containing protein [Listeria monocytogenes]MDB03032.1 DUF1642 domain-containing protein [Listeria monocytogenes]MDB35376.1 DUF1642 domain-containing protein [Listeria monocytogenes]